MSTEIVKKRGRPKKVISDPIEIDLPETKKSTTRAKSTKAAPKPAKKAPIITTASKPAPKPPAPTTPAATKTESKAPTPAPSKPASKPPVTPETSKILGKVREISAKTIPAPADPAKSSKPSLATLSPAASAQASKPPTLAPKAPSPPSKTTPPPQKPIPASKPLQIPPTARNPPPKIPIAALNSQIVSNIASRAGAKPNTNRAAELSASYKSIARKVTYTIVAMPILLVTSWVLYERLILGEDRKLLVKPGLTPAEALREDAKGGSEASSQS